MMRKIVRAWAHLSSRVLESPPGLSRDSTAESLRQRREIQDSTSVFIDQAAVRAALEG